MQHIPLARFGTAERGRRRGRVSRSPAAGYITGRNDGCQWRNADALSAARSRAGKARPLNANLVKYCFVSGGSSSKAEEET